MTLVLPKNPSFGESFGAAIGKGAGEGLEEARKKQTLSEDLTRENADIEAATGIKMPKGLQNPELRKSYLSEQLKAKNKENLHDKKMKGIGDILQRGMKKPQGVQLTESEQDAQENLSGQPQQQEEELNDDMIDFSKFSDADIAELTMLDPNAGRAAQHSKDVALRERTAAKKLASTEKTAAKKEVAESYGGENGKFITKTYDQYEDSMRRGAILDKMTELEESGDTSDSGVINLLHQLGLNEEWLKNPANEEYQKLAFDLLGGGSLQADYGSRVLASEFGVSLKRIPQLIQTPEGRRQIAENMKAMLLPAKLKHERMQYYTDKAEREGKPLPHDLRGKILKDIKPQLEEAYDTFKERNGRYKVKEGTPLNDDAIEKYFYLSNGDEAVARKMMKDDGYDVD
jgi:hypothetical protein